MLTEACTTATWRQPAQAESIAIANGVVVRDEEDGSVSVLVTVHQGEDWAAGFVRFRDRARYAKHGALMGDLARMRAWQALSVQLDDQPVRAYEAARAGLEATIVVCRYHEWKRHLRGYANRLTHEVPEAVLPDVRADLEQTIRECALRLHRYVL